MVVCVCQLRCPRRHNSCVIVMCFRCSDVDQGSIVSRSKWNPPKSYSGFFLVQKPFYPGCGVGGGWVGRCRLTIDDCCVRGPLFHGLTYYVGAVIVGDFLGELFTHPTNSSKNISMSSLKHVERTNDAAHDVASAVCVSVRRFAPRYNVVFISATLCVLFSRRHRRNTICIIDVSVKKQKKQFVLHATVFFGSLYQ